MLKSKLIISILFLSFCQFLGCKSSKDTQIVKNAYEILDDDAYNIFSLKAQLEVLDSGFLWTEGPLWLDATDQLIFNDIPQNKTFSWSEKSGTTVYLSPSGFTSDQKKEGEPGANGMALNSEGQLILCQHGDRRMAIMESSIDSPVSNFETIVDTYQGQKFNSPNDVAISKSGNLYFTDPPYGLSSPELQEVSFNGVYRFSNSGELTVLDSTLTRPNGLAFSPDEKYLYVANSDPNNAIWVRYPLNEETGQVATKEILYNATGQAQNEKGLPDGLKVNDLGYIFATGPGGVWIFNPKGKVIAKIRTGQATSNCAFGSNQTILYITADDYLMRATFK